MLKKLGLGAVMLLSSTILFAQEGLPSWEEPLKSKGEVPADFYRDYEARIAREAKDVAKRDSRFEARKQEEFLQESEFYLSRFLASGDILFGDTITNYCRELVDLLLKDDPELRAKIRVYTVRTPAVNAAATNSGILLINQGLVAEAENEAQLAAVLAHEIIHYREKHSVEQYLERERRERSSSVFGFSDDSEDELEGMNQYSQEHEFEADTRGLEDYYLPAGYSHREAEYMMDVLLYSYLPFDEIPYEKEWLERGPVNYPMEYYLEDLKPITAREDFDDSKSSHPNIKKRKEAILERETAGEDGAKYLLSEAGFKEVQKLARFESARMFLEQKQLGEAMYQSYLLDKTYGPSAFSAYLRTASLHQLAEYGQYKVLDKAVRHYEKVEGQSQQMYFLLRHLSYQDLRALAVAHSYEFWQNYPEDPKAEALFQTAMQALFETTTLQAEDFVAEFEAEAREEKIDSVREASRGRSSKIANIQTKRGQSDLLKGKEAAYHYHFVPYLSDSLFAAVYAEKAKDYAKEKEEEIEESGSEKLKNRLAQLENTQKEKKVSKNKYKKPHEALGIDRVLFITPQYAQQHRSLTGEQRTKYEKTESKRYDYYRELMKVAEVAGLRYDFLDYSNLRQGDVESFNDLMILRSFLYERIRQPKAIDFVSSAGLAQEVMAKYKTKYLVFAGTKSTQYTKAGKGTAALLSLFFYPSLPFAIANIFTPDYKSQSYILVLDTETGEVVFYDETDYKTLDAPDYLRSVLYNQLIQLKQKSI